MSFSSFSFFIFLVLPLIFSLTSTLLFSLLCRSHLSLLPSILFRYLYFPLISPIHLFPSFPCVFLPSFILYFPCLVPRLFCFQNSTFPFPSFPSLLSLSSLDFFPRHSCTFSFPPFTAFALFFPVFPPFVCRLMTYFSQVFEDAKDSESLRCKLNRGTKARKRQTRDNGRKKRSE